MIKKLECVMPSIRTYLGDAFCHSIIDKYAVSTGWNYDKYIKLQYTPHDRRLKYADYDYYDFVQGEGVFVKSFIEFADVQSSQKKICSFVEEMIENSEYLFALWDENIIVKEVLNICRPGKYIHGCFVYGYDSSQKIFFSQGYLTGEKFIQFEVSYEAFYRALCSAHANRNIALIGYKLLNNYIWEFSFERMYADLEEYIQLNGENKLYNIQAENAFLDDALSNKRIHIPSVYCMYEHKKIMDDRVKFLLKNKFIASNYQILFHLDSISKVSKKVLLLSVKYNLCANQSILPSIVKHGKKMIAEEIELIKMLL